MKLISLLALCGTIQALPLWFEPNQGQAHPSVQFLSRSVYLGSARIGARRDVRAEGLDLETGISSYFIGNHPKKWRAGVPHYGKVRYKGIYPDVDLIYYGNAEGHLEYDFELAAGGHRSRTDLALLESTRT